MKMQTLCSAKIRSLFVLLSLSSFAFVVGCGPADEQSDLKADDAAMNLDSLSRTLGSGFDSLTNKKLAPCMDASKFVYSGTNSSDLSFLTDATYDDLVDETTVGLYGKASLFGLVSAKLSGDIITTLATTDQTGAFIYKFEVAGKSAVIPTARLNDHGMAVFSKKDPLNFRKNCGDQFVEQVKLGAKLYVGLKYTFTSKEDKEKLLIQLKGSLLWGLIKFSKQWSKESQELLKNVRVSVEAFQIGGDPRKLEELKASVHQGSCAGDDAEKCSASLDRLIQYGRVDFANQLNNMAMSEAAYKGPVILSVGLKSYSDQKIYDKDQKNLLSIVVDSSVTPGTAAADSLNKLNLMDAQIKIEQSRNNALKDFRLSPEERASVDVALNDLSRVQGAIPPLRDLCNQGLSDKTKAQECSAKVGDLQNKANQALKPVSLKPR